jgi:enamine deaminase RidA (YjgF/YER057c/UK114 family)
MIIKRWSSSGKGRSSCVALDGMVWTVANAMDMTANFESQVAQSFAMLDMHLTEALSARTHILSLQVILADIRHFEVFDALWKDWIGPDPAHWPQRACYQAVLTPGLMIELVAIAATASAKLLHIQ